MMKSLFFLNACLFALSSVGAQPLLRAFPGAEGMLDSADGLRADAAAGNVILDPSFEQGRKLWNLEDSGSVFVEEPVRTGARALRLINDFDGHTKGMHNVSQRRIPGVEGGREYEYSVWVKGDNIKGIGQGGKPITELRWLDRHGKKIGRGLYMWAPYGSYPYMPLSIHAQAPANATACDIHFRSWWDCTGGTSYWDDVALRLRITVSGKCRLLGSYEAEEAAVRSKCTTCDEGIGFTGAGYIHFGKTGAFAEWHVRGYAGPHVLSFRYAAEAGTRPCVLTVNGIKQGELRLVATGMPISWATAERVVALKPGDNVIHVLPKKARVGLHMDRLDIFEIDRPSTDRRSGGNGHINGHLSDDMTQRQTVLARCYIKTDHSNPTAVWNPTNWKVWDGSGWSSDFRRRKPVITWPERGTTHGQAWYPSVIYLPSKELYLAVASTLQPRGYPDPASKIYVYEAPAPQGPWAQVYASGNIYLQGDRQDRIFSPNWIPGWCNRDAGKDNHGNALVDCYLSTAGLGNFEVSGWTQEEKKRYGINVGKFRFTFESQ